MKELQSMWYNFSKSPFPSSAHEVELDLELLDTTIAGCICTLVTAGSLDPDKMKTLENSIRELESRYNLIPIDAQDYFKKLLNIGSHIAENRANYIR